VTWVRSPGFTSTTIVRRVLHAQYQRRVEIAQRRQQVARVRVGFRQQAVELGGAQVREAGVALQLEVALQVVGDVAVLALDLHREGLGIPGGLDGALLVGGLALVAGTAQHAAGGQGRKRGGQHDAPP
jgi:hypothetical protein